MKSIRPKNTTKVWHRPSAVVLWFFIRSREIYSGCPNVSVFSLTASVSICAVRRPYFRATKCHQLLCEWRTARATCWHDAAARRWNIYRDLCTRLFSSVFTHPFTESVKIIKCGKLVEPSTFRQSEKKRKEVKKNNYLLKNLNKKRANKETVRLYKI